MPRHENVGSLQVSEAVRRLNPQIYGLASKPTPGLAGVSYSPSLVPVIEESLIPPPAGPRYRSKWEAQFHEVLKARFPGASIEYEPIRLQLAKKTTYTPDFLVVVTLPSVHAHLPPAQEFTFWEVKGFWRPSARVKIKVAADKYRWAKFIAVVKRKKKDGGGWDEEAFQP
jgi:hypothetical protein